MITLGRINRRETVRYLGGARVVMNDRMERLMDECEEELLRRARPAYIFKTEALPDNELITGEDVARHLRGCDRAVLSAATLGAETDRLIREMQIRDMAKAVVLDSMASVAVEQVCRSLDLEIAERYPGCFLTFRFSPGYGDYPVTMQKVFLRRLDAPRKIGLSMNESCLLVPSKSVTAIAGLSKTPVERQRRGCAVCSLRETCKYIRNGEHCGF